MRPYAPPQSQVRDMQPDLRAFGIRSPWVYTALLIYIVGAAAYGVEMWLPILTPQLLASLALTVLYAIAPLRRMALWAPKAQR